MRLFTVLFSLATFVYVSPSVTPAASPAGGTRKPIIVELFTSEGCSSCPPADALLSKLDQSQPIPGALVVALSEHVDYWDRLGWKDRFSSPMFTRRQEGYARRFHLDSAYTPQAVIDGATQAVGSNARQIQDAIRQSLQMDKLRVQISPIFKNDKGASAVRVQVNGSEKSVAGRAPRLMVALADDTAVSNVSSGENSGRRMEHVAVVQSLVDVGPLDAAGAFDADVVLANELRQWSGKRIIAFVQEQPFGKIRGADVRLLPSALVK